MKSFKPVRETPYRSPMIVSEKIQDILQGKVVCELGCAEGDNMMFMSRYAKRVFGIEFDLAKSHVAQERGFNVITGNYFEIEIPDADVYYFWPTSADDSPRLIDKILRSKPNFVGHIIVGGDTYMQREKEVINRLAKRGELREISYNEGTKNRQSGTFLVLIIEVGH